MVAGGQDHPGALGQAAQRLIEEGDGVIGWDGAVVDVPGDEDGVDRLGGDELDEVVGEGGVRVIEHAPVEGAPQVPVGGVEDPHADTVSQPTDINDGTLWRSVTGLLVRVVLGAVLLVH